MVTAMDTAVSMVSLDEYRTSIRYAVEKEIAAIFEVEVRKAAREFARIGRRTKRGWKKENI